MKQLKEILPILGFFIIYKWFGGLIPATIALIVLSLIFIIISLIKKEQVSLVNIISCIILLIAGSLTIFSGNALFIKMKPTVLNLLFSIILFTGIYFKKGLIKYILGNNLQMEEKNWLILSRRFAIFFLCLAGLNELVWRNVTEATWVNFKVFGLLGIIIIFILSQSAFIFNNRLNVKD